MTPPLSFSTRLRVLSKLDPRALACLRIGTALVLAWDMVRVLRVAPDWWAMQAYGEPKLPPWLVLGSETVTLQLAAIAVLVVSLLLALGWRTGPVTAAAWISACAFQYAARATADYHNAVLCALLYCSLVLPTAAVASLDARAGRPPWAPDWLVASGSAGLLVLLAWIYLSTAAAKTGSAWWSEGSAVWLALLDRGTPTTMGRWLALAAPPWTWPAVTWLALLLEWSAPALLIWRRTRLLAVIGLGLFPLCMWPLLRLGSFPLTMVVALSALLPGSVWDRVRWQPSARAAVIRRRPGMSGRWVAGLMVLGLAITLEGERVVAWEGNGDRPWPYPGARHMARLRYLLGMEVIWGMYAPEPFRHVGWWVGVGWQTDGTVVDPITGQAPTLDPPDPAGADANLRWLALSDAPELIQGWGVQHTYRNFLLAQRNHSGARRLQRLALVWVHEPLTPFRAPHQRQPLLVLSWPENDMPAAMVEQVLGTALQAPVYDEDSGVLLGGHGVSLSAEPQWLP